MSDSNGKASRGMGTDVAIVSSMMFAAQFVCSGVTGSIIKGVGTLLVVPIMATVTAILCAIVSCFITYVEN